MCQIVPLVTRYVVLLDSKIYILTSSPKYAMMLFMGPTEVIERRKASQKAKRAEKTAAIRRLLWDKQEGRCAYCCKSIALESCEVDHVIARAKGGRNEINNYVIACTSCNNMKLDHRCLYIHVTATHPAYL